MTEEQLYTGPQRPPGWPGYNSRNLNLLAVYLWENVKDEDFSMNGLSIHTPIGYSMVIIPPWSLDDEGKLSPEGDGFLPESFEAYSSRVLIRRVNFLPRWQWCFSKDWAKVDNTAKGCAQRIFQLVSEGLPRNWAEQLLGKEPLSYTELVPTMVIPEDEPQYEGGSFQFGRVSVHDKMKAAREKT